MRLFGHRKKNLSSPRNASIAEQFPDFTAETTKIIERVQPFTMTSPERISALCEAVGYLCRTNIPGAIVECGVWRGGSLLAAVENLLIFGQTNRAVWLYDTFEGMTAPTAADKDFLGRSAEQLLDESDREDEHSVWCWSQLDQVRQLLFSTGYPQERFQFVVGPVEKTIPASLPDQIALLRLDTDWYESTRHELIHLMPKLVPGGVLIVDDYGHWNGCRQAVDEYFQQHQIPMLLHRIDYTGRIGVLLNRIEPGGPDSERDGEKCNVFQ
jgi:O-methyltransferase